MLLELFVELMQPLIIAHIIDDGIMAEDFGQISTWGLVLLGLSLLAFTSGIINTFFASHAAQSFAFDLRNAIFRKIQTFSMATYLKFPTSSLITRLTNDVHQVAMTLFMSLRIMIRAPLSVVASLIMAFVVNWKIAIFLLIGTPILALFLYLIVKNGVRLFGQVQRRLDRVNRAIQETLQALPLVKAYMRMNHEDEKFHQVAKDLKDDTIKALRTMELMMPVMTLVLNFSLLFVIWFGVREISFTQAQVGDLVAIMNYAMRITGNFAMFAFILNGFSRAKASSERMKEVLVVGEDGLEELMGEKEKQKLDEIGTIKFEGVSFTYPNSKRPVLEDITFEVKQGEKIAIMGATGSGKSTLLNLIPRFYEPTRGNIYISNQNIKNLPLKYLRSMIGFVPQRSLLFTGTIRDNVIWGNRNAELGEVMEATKKAQIHDTIMEFPNGYETRVGQKGVNLSGGQKQRLSIARALIKMPKILILDDSTSALDIRTESALWKALEEFEATMFVVTQKIHTAKGADQILLLDEGRIVAFGTHDELLAKSKLYRQIAQSQQEKVGEEE
jgi:ATP-binding cassette subfamily B multidrug efflux pump